MATTTPNYGWDVPTSTDYVADGAVAIETLGDDIDASLFSITGGKNVGMVHISTVTFTSQTNIQINNCFSSAFDNYVIVNTFDTLADNSVFIKMSSGGTPTSGGTAYRWARQYFFGTSGVANNGGSTGAANATFQYISSGTVVASVTNVQNPFLAKPTIMTQQSFYGGVFELAGINHNASTSYDGINISSGTALTGNFRIYGLRNS